MTVEEVKGIVIRTVDVGENDKLLTVFTEEKGRITASVRGSRSLKSRYFSVAQLFCFSRFILCKKSDRYYVKEAELIDNFFAIREDLGKTALASYIAEALSYVTTEEADTGLYRLALNTLFAITNGIAPLPRIKAVFEFRAAALLGFMPDVSGCTYCGEEHGEFLLDVMNGALICHKCRMLGEDRAIPPTDDDARTAQIVTLIDEATKDAMAYVFSCPADRIFSFRLPSVSERLFSSAAETYFINQIERSFPSLEFYKDCVRD